MDRNQPKVVKRIVVVAMMALMSFTTAVGQDIYSGSTSLVVINSEWENVTLSGVNDEERSAPRTLWRGATNGFL